MSAFVGIPAMSTTSRSRTSSQQAPTCSSVSRRKALQLACMTVSATLLPRPAKAVSLYEKKVIANLDKVSLAIAKTKSLKASVKSWKPSLSEEDSLYVLRYIPVWLEPGRIAMTTVAAQQEVDIGDKGNAKKLADAILGHLFELKTEAKGGKKDGVIRELDEFIETADDFLAIPALQSLKKL